jgi:hypothetical protein
MAYISNSELASYLLSYGFVEEELDTDTSTRYLDGAISDWERLVGVKPFLAVSSTKVYDPRDIQADRRGYILDLGTPLSAQPTLVKSGIDGASLGTTFTLYTDYLLPDNNAPYTQLIFRTYPQFRLEITGAFGYTNSAGIGADVNNALYYLASARAIEELNSAGGTKSRIKTGLIEISQPDDPTVLFRKRAKEIAESYRLF